MKVTDDMVQVAVKKAVEAGLLPRDARHDQTRFYDGLMELILQAAFELAEDEGEVMPPVFHSPGMAPNFMLPNSRTQARRP